MESTVSRAKARTRGDGARRVRSAMCFAIACALGGCVDAPESRPPDERHGAFGECYQGPAEVTGKNLASSLTHWVRSEAIRTSGSTGMAGFGAIVGDARMVGFGEAAHGLHEFPSVRNDLFAYLVEQHGFLAITLESGIVEARMADLYVRDVDGIYGVSLEDALDRGFTHNMGPWEETRELLLWMRAHNEEALESGGPVLRVAGKDLPREGDTLTIPLAEVERFLQTAGALSWSSELESIYAPLSTLASQSADVTETVLDAMEAAGYPRAIDPDLLDPITSISYELLSSSERADLAFHVDALVQWLESNEAELSAAAGAQEYEWALRMAIVSRQMIADLESRIEHPADPGTAQAVALLEKVYASLGKPVPPVNPAKFASADDPEALAEYFAGRASRERHLADNAIWAMERYGKLVNFAHNGHLQRMGLPSTGGTVEGAFIAESLGDDYVVIAGTMDRFIDPYGKTMHSDAHGSEISQTEDCHDCIEKTLAAADVSPFVLDLRPAKGCSQPGWLKEWLAQEHTSRWQYAFEPVVLAKQYDAIYWIDDARPGFELGGH